MLVISQFIGRVYSHGFVSLVNDAEYGRDDVIFPEFEYEV
jgi:hypothetical protein